MIEHSDLVIASSVMPVSMVQAALPATSERGIEFARRVEKTVLAAPQVEIPTYHVIHDGVYSRTICIPKDTVLTSVLFKIPTMLVYCGKASILLGDGEEVLIEGYHVFPTSARRKVIVFAHEDTWGTMYFKTNARTVEEAEQEFTDEADQLFSRRGQNEVLITGD